MGEISLFNFIFSKKKYTTRYLVFEFLDRTVLFVFGIWIFLIPKRIWYLVFGFSQYRILFDIWYSVISEN